MARPLKMTNELKFLVGGLLGLGMTLYAAIYVLWPLLTNGVKLYSQWMSNVHFWGTLIGGIGMGAFMGMAGLQGMLRRTIYFEGEYEPYMWLAGISGDLILIGFVFFMINIIMSVGLKGLLGIFTNVEARHEGSGTRRLIPNDPGLRCRQALGPGSIASASFGPRSITPD
jgi:hypothetical protein